MSLKIDRVVVFSVSLISLFIIGCGASVKQMTPGGVELQNQHPYSVKIEVTGWEKIDKLQTSGITVEGGYFFTNKLETMGRFSDKKVKNGNQTTEMTFGVNYYFDDNNAKLQFNVCHFTDKSTSAVKKADNRIYLLYQIVF